MKKAITLINPVLVYAKYLLLAAVLLLSMLLLGQFLLANFNLDASIQGNMMQTILPFFATAIVSMLVVKKLKNK